MQNPKLKGNGNPKKICAVLPSYNEEKNIGTVIKGVLKNNIDEVVVDDGSVDGTSELAKKNGAVVIRHNRKKGKGTSLKDGLTWATSNDYDYIITIDADGQHNPLEIPLFIKKADADAKTEETDEDEDGDAEKQIKQRTQ